ncbi:MAG: DUF4160 domain-containing protein [Oscillospiraceae bacterium]|jgi:hypothetical protein|nr:DUF4160 domain-containing protein [Oscillospiraceae bacterium]
MPVLSQFFGIAIYLYNEDTEKHHAPHIHAFYAENEASFDLRGKKLAGTFPRKQTKILQAWILIHEEELAAAWRIYQKSGEIIKIEGLR